MQQIVKKICENLEQDKPLVMATILSKQGSAPRAAGTKMLVHTDGHISGTIGGGWVEAQVQKLAVDFFEQKIPACIREFTLDSKAFADMDMVCGGNITILVEYLSPSQENKDIFSSLLQKLNASQDCFVVSRLGDKSKDSFNLHRGLIAGQEKYGALQLAKNLLDELIIQALKMRSPGLIRIEEEEFFIEPAQSSGTLYILGAGHLAIQTADLAHKVGFKIVVMDDRSQFANSERFPMAKVHALDSFKGCFEPFAITSDSFITIMTRGHLYDQMLLEQALKTQAGYIGMIGSRSKKKAIYDYLLGQGVSQQRLDEVYAPIGLSIGAKTPEEIAVSIVAELIQARSKN